MSNITDKARALLLTGRMICTKSAPSEDGVAAWAAVAPIPEWSCDAGNPAIRVFSFEVDIASLTAGESAICNLKNKRCVTVRETANFNDALSAVACILESWKIDPTRLCQAELDSAFPLWLCTVLIRSVRFEDATSGKRLAINDRAYALLLTGHAVCTEITPSRDDLRAWVAIYPFVKGKTRFGPEGDRPFGGAGNPTFRVMSFEVDAQSLSAGYDLAGSQINERSVEVCSSLDFDASLQEVEAVLDSWRINPSRLISTDQDEDYPL